MVYQIMYQNQEYNKSIYQESMHVRNLKIPHFLCTKFSYSYANCSYKSPLYVYGVQTFVDIKHKKTSETISLMEDVLRQYEIHHQQKFDQYNLQSLNNKNITKTLSKIAKFKGDMRLNYQHRLNSLINLFEQNFDIISIGDKIKIRNMLSQVVTYLSNNLQYNVLSKRLILEIIQNIEMLTVRQRIFLISYTSNYEKIHAPIQLQNKKLWNQKCPYSQKSTPIIKRLLIHFQQIMIKEKIQIIKYNENPNINSLFLEEQQMAFLLKTIISLQQDEPHIVKVTLNKLIIPNLSKIRVMQILKIMNVFYQNYKNNIFKYLTVQDWILICTQVSNKSLEIKEIKGVNFLINALVMYNKIQDYQSLSKRINNSVMIVILEQIMLNLETNSYDSKIHSHRIIQILLKIFIRDNSSKLRNRIQQLFQEYLYFIVKDIRQKDYSSKSLINVLISINEHRRFNTYLLSNRQIKNLIMMITQDLWHKCDSILNDPLKNQDLVNQLDFLIHEKDARVNGFIGNKNTKVHKGASNQDQFCFKYNQQLRKRENYFIEYVPQQICNKIISVREKLKDRQYSNEQQNDDDDF